MFEHSLLAMLLSALFCWAVIFHAKTSAFMQDKIAQDLSAKQASHQQGVPRLGGLAVGLSILVVVLMDCGCECGLFGLTSLAIVVSSTPVYALGIKEDIYRNVSSSARLIAALMSGGVAVLITGMWIDYAEPAWFGFLMSIALIGMPVTALTTAGFSNAINLIDGLNGFASMVSILIGIGLILVANASGVSEVTPLVLVVLAATIGFLFFNFPGGKIFLGDGGSYLIGHLLSWVGVVIIFSGEDVSPWAIMLIFFWPFADTMFAIFRRIAGRVGIASPDRLHFHQIVMRFLVISAFGTQRKARANPVSTILMAPFVAAPVLTGAYFYDDGAAAGTALVAFGSVFVLTYYWIKAAARSRVKLPFVGNSVA